MKKKIYYLANISLIHLGGASEAQNFNYNKQEKLIKNDMLFIKKFYGKNEVHKALKNINRADNLRLKLLQYFFYRFFNIAKGGLGFAEPRGSGGCRQSLVVTSTAVRW